MDKALVDHIARFLNSHRNKTVQLDMLNKFANSLKHKQKKAIKKIGLRNFIVNHPKEFAIVDDQVVLISDSVLLHPVVQPSLNERAISKTPEPPKKITPPSKAAIESIKKEIQSSNFCMVCSDEMKIYSVGVCFHPICFKCSTKLRVLCSDKQCPVCRTTLTQVAFTSHLAPENELRLSTFIKEQKYGIMFENQEIRSMHKKLLEHRCPIKNCTKKYDDFDELKAHLQAKHGEYFCDLCVRQCKKFTHERETYSTSELKNHEGSGDPNSVVGGHPLCPFCDVRYLDEDELFRHLQQHHCSCHLCHETSHVFYADIAELWHEHHFQVHFACTEQTCYGVSSAVFKTEDELKQHVRDQHTVFNMSPAKRREQPVDLNVTFGQRSGLQFGQNSRASGFRLTPVRGIRMALSSEGHLTCTGRVVNLTSYYGFVQPDGSWGSFANNVFFNQQACCLGPDEDLKDYFNEGDRVQVQAVKASQSHRSKWRAIDVTELPQDASDVDSMSVHSYSVSEVSFRTTDDVDTPEPPSMDAFPALPRDSNASPIGADSANNPTNWNAIVKTKKQVKVADPVAAASLPSSSKKVSKKRPRSGTGIIHHNLEPHFGFITNSNNKFEDNIFFNLKAYTDGSGIETYVGNLMDELKPGDKVHYILEEPDKGNVRAKTKSKFRAWKVWKWTPDTLEKSPVPIPDKPSAVRSRPATSKVKPKKSNNNGIKNKAKHKETTAPLFSPPSMPVEKKSTSKPSVPSDVNVKMTSKPPRPSDIDVKMTSKSPQPSKIDVKITSKSPQPSNLDVKKTSNLPKLSDIAVKTTSKPPQPSDINVKITSKPPRPSDIDVKMTSKPPQPSDIDVKKTSNLSKLSDIAVKITSKSPQPSDVTVKMTSKRPQPSDINVEVTSKSPQPSNLDVKKTSNLSKLSDVDVEVTAELPELSDSNFMMDLDTYEAPVDEDLNVGLDQMQFYDDKEIFRKLLLEIIGSRHEEILFKFDEELAINDVETDQIAFVRFSETENPKIHSKLFPSNGSKVRHRQFHLPDITGFDVDAVDTLRDQGILLENDDNLYYVNKSSFYITMRRNSAGFPTQLFLHTPFNSYIQ